MVIMEQETVKSAHHPGVVAAMLAARQSLKEKQKVLHLFTDTWCEANCLAIQSGKWKVNDWKINGQDTWSKEFLTEFYNTTKEVRHMYIMCMPILTKT